MTPPLRAYLAVALACLLALTGQSMAAMRGTTGATGQIVICSGTGPVTIDVDAEGRPMGPPHYCPDCLMHLLTAAEPPDQSGIAAPAAADPTRSRQALMPANGIVCATMARGPPLAV